MSTHGDKKEPEPCSCKIPGFCNRHGFVKNVVLHSVCKNSPERRREWDRQMSDGTSANGKPVPQFAGRVLRFAKSMTKWVQRGFKMRTPEEIERIQTICAQCPTGKFKGGVCTDCGCQTQKAKRIWWNKVAWAHEHCPDKHW